MYCMSYSQALRNLKPQLVIAVGPAGTGKTMLACKQAIHHLSNDNVEKIIITRPAVPMDGESHGYLPGTLEEKMKPWMVPIYDYFSNDLGKKNLEYYIKNDFIEICPLAYMRGRTFKNAYIIADEMQNSSVNQMKNLLTRLDEDSKLVITGDLEQKDSFLNGLDDLLERLPEDLDSSFVHLQEFTEDDVKRSQFVRYILSMYRM